MTMNSEALPHPECYKRHADIENHIAEGKWVRGLIVTLALAMMLQIGSFIYLWGRLTQVVETSSVRITCLEDIHPRTTK